MILFESVSFSFPDIPVLKDVNFRLENGEFVGLLGPNGGGKSTFLRLCLGLLKTNAGRIENDFENIAYLAQTTSISDASFPATVKEVVSLGFLGSKKRLDRSEKKAKLNAILERFDLAPLKDRLVNELSGGQMQRVKLAKALVGGPDLLVLDEPDAGMDEESHHELLKAIKELKGKGVSILFVSHHPEDLKEADKIYFIEDGKMLSYEEEKERGHHHAIL